MGASSSCNGADYGPMDQSLEALIMKTINFNDEDVRTAIRSFSFNGRESEPLLAIGPRKMIIEGSLSFKGREPGPFNMKTKSPRKIPQVQKIGSPVATGPRTSRFMAAAKAAVQQNATFKPGSPKHEAALKLQKVYKSFRTRRKLADCAVLAEQQWWKLLDFALLKRSSVSFFDIDRPESVVSRWSRARTRAAKVGKGLSKDEKAQKLALQHWLEAIDPRHRYGHNLHFYYSAWLHCESRQPFFYWLDVGEGKEVNLERCPRSRLRQECIKYLGPKEREEYEVEVKEGKFMYKNSRNLLDTSQGPPEAKWIFVLSTSRKLYVGQKKKGTFQHSSFLAGGATSSAGRLVVERGILKAIWPHSGHYLPTERNFQEFVSFLKEKNVDLTDVKRSPDDESEWGSAASSLPNPVAAAPDETGAKEAATQQLHGSASDQANAPGKSTGTGGAAAPKEEPISGTPLARRRPALSKLKVERTAIDRLYALYLQRVFKEFQESDEDTDDDKTSSSSDSDDKVSSDDDSPNCSFSPGNPHAATGGATEKRYKTNLDGEETVVVSRESILQRINTKKGMKSYQLGKQLSCRWTTGAGPRIGCVRDYPSELQFQALEQVNLSPRSAGISRLGPSSSRSLPGSTLTPWTPGARSPLRVSTSAEAVQPSPPPPPPKVSASAETLQPSSRR